MAQRSKVKTHDGIPQDSVSGVEAHGIDHIPENERYGSARQLVGLWAAPQVNYLVLVMGGALVSMGLSFVQAIGVIIVGNLFSVLTGFISASGPASGTPSQIIQRALFGTRGNLVNQVFTGWIVNVMFLALNWTGAAVIIFAVLDETFALKLDDVAKGFVIAVLAALTLLISVYGYNFITRVYQLMTWIFLGVFAVATVFLLTAVHQSPARAPGLSGFDFWVVALAGVSMLGCTPISYTNAADFARYLPKATPVKRIVTAVSTGYLIPSVLISILGAYVTAALKAQDPQNAIQALLPVWFSPVFALVVVAGTIANNAMTAYSSGLVLQTIGVKLRRSVTVIADGIFGVIITILAVLVWDFVDAINTLLQLIVIIVAPLMSVYLADMWLRRNRYDGRDLELGHPNGKYWYSSGYNIAGITSFGVGLTACLLTVYTDFYVGPVNQLLGGLDISFEVGLLLPGLLYLALMNKKLAPIRNA
jgi:NCS1 family nucleobase:cation symporter-1